MGTSPLDHDAEFARVRSDWQQITPDPDPLPFWETELARMRADVAQLRADGMWRSGRRSLLGALEVHHSEVLMCRGLGWLLNPDGWHGLGTRFLDGLLAKLDVQTSVSASATLAIEEPRHDTRADLVIRSGTTTVLIEAKIWAWEQPNQCDRLARHWRSETPKLVFLTRDGRCPTTAVESKGLWLTLAWSDIAEVLDQVVNPGGVIELPDGLDPGVSEYLRTLKIYGESRA